MMAKKKTPWVKALGLTSADFKQRPQGHDPLVWGLKNKVINQDEYLAWATDYYQLPAIKPEFFSMAVDFTLIQKHSHIHDWNAHCYPIYTWQDTLFVACLEPTEINTQEKLCFVVAPFFPMENAWDKFQNSKDSQQTETEVHQTSTASEQNVAQRSQAATLEEPVSPETPPVPELQENGPQVSNEVPKVDVVQEASAQEKSSEAPLDLPDLNFDSLGDDSQQETQKVETNDQETSSEEESQKEEDNSFDSLDFSAMGADTPAEASEAPQKKETKVETAAEITQTKIDEHDLNNFTTATETIHAPRETVVASGENTEHKELDFDNLSTGGISLEGDPEKSEITKTKLGESSDNETAKKKSVPPPPPVMKEDNSKEEQAKSAAPVPPPPPQPAQENPSSKEEAIPDLSDLMAHQTENPKRAPGMEHTHTELKIPKHNNEEPVILKGEQAPQPPVAPLIEEEEYDDDYTPIPEVSEGQKEAHADKESLELNEVTQTNLTENTITYSDQPVHTPPEALISDKELTGADKLENCKSLKEVMAHLFSHLTRYYKKLLYVGREDGKLFYPKFVYGPWKMTSMAWKMHINLSNPNIFRIAHKSGHPFHGKISDNPFNDKYFEWWSKGKKPDFATIYPVVVEEEIIGFITCFGKGPEFDELGSLKKIENLVSICRKSFVKSSKAKAA